MFLDQRSRERWAPKSVLDMFSRYRVPLRAQDASLAFLDKLAATRAYDWFVAVSPMSSQNPVGDTDSVESQFTVVPGSLLWGLTGCAFTENEQSGAMDVPSEFRFEIWDQGRPSPVSITKANGGSLAGLAVAPFSQPGPFLFDIPYVIGGTGLVSVRITNLASAPALIQLAMHFAQPKSAVWDTAANGRCA